MQEVWDARGLGCKRFGMQEVLGCKRFWDARGLGCKRFGLPSPVNPKDILEEVYLQLPDYCELWIIKEHNCFYYLSIVTTKGKT